MSPKLQAQIAKSNEQALAAFVSKKAEIDEMLTRLRNSATTTSTTAPMRSTGAMSAPWDITRSS